MDEHQRRVWGRMIDEVEAYRAGRLTLSRAAENLKGLLEASDLHSRDLVMDFWHYFQEIDMELELRTQPWVYPEGSASDERLSAGVDAFELWVRDVLARASQERE